MNNKNLISVFFNSVYQETINNLKKPPKFNEKDIYYKLKLLSIDARGSFGQRFLVNAFKQNGFKSYNDKDQNKDWDIKLKNYRIELKTATLDVNNKFQHEGIHKTDNYDLLVFLDIAPNQIFLKGMLYNEIDFEKLHLRGGGRKTATGTGYKYDYNLKEHLKEKNEIVILEDFRRHANIWIEKLNKINI